MTEQSEGHGGTQSVAALAAHVDALRRNIEDLAAKVGTVSAKQREHTALLHDLSDLRHQVEQILATLTEDDDDSPTTWFWLTMSDQERDEKLSELSDWVETVLRAQYPDYLADIRPCWPNHPEASWELAWLYHLWSASYLAERPAPRDAADWHDRWFPGCIRRLSEVLGGCQPICQKRDLHGDRDS